MPDTNTLILDHQKIEQKINRIAYQIYEDHYDQDQIIMAGIAKQGFVFAQLIQQKIEDISQLKVKLHELHIDKTNPIESVVELNIDQEELLNQSIILVDDVLNSGKTMMYGLQYFLKGPIKRLTTAVLVDRSHKRFPVNADYVGISLATTLKEHIEVSFDEGNFQAYLC